VLTLIVVALMYLAVAPVVSAATYGPEVLAAVLLAEARGEGERGMEAVAEVTRRRADTQGTTMLAVLRPGAFSSLNGTSRDALLRRFHRHSMFPAALRIAQKAYNEPHSLGNLTRGATHFTRRSERPYWALGNRPVVIIGNHAFYVLQG
jgi:spore germination cell wall hydrolase CwlJ-like protein